MCDELLKAIDENMATNLSSIPGESHLIRVSVTFHNLDIVWFSQ